MENILNRVAFEIFGLEIYWYGIIMAISILVAFVLVLIYCQKKKLGTDFAFEALLATVVPGILCARLFSVLFESGTSILDYFDFRSGGMSIIGAVLGGACGIAILCAIRKKNFFDVADIVVPVLILAQGIGRWGNYVNQEVYGAMVTDPDLQFFPYAVFIDAEGAWFQALFFYESVLNILGFALLSFLLLKFNKRMLTTGTYFVYYGIVRTVLESFRTEEYILKFRGIPVSQAISIVMIIVGSAILTLLAVEEIRKRRQAKKQQPKTAKETNEAGEK